ncbi:MAG: GxxExxY protein [Chitinophagales bacterium]|nr:GxxExxY protein [Chitinophagales bacterium]
MNELKLNDITGLILEAAFKVHSNLGPGLLESAYEACLEHELLKLGLTVNRQVPIPLIYDGVQLDVGYRLDMLVEGKVIVELKSVLQMNEIFTAQMISYLRLSGHKVGLLLNFNVSSLKDGIKRIVN